jgi:predicted nucleic acid-binding Zn ribbon protein
MGEWYSMKCLNCGNEEAVHTIHSEEDHETNCQQCDLIEREDEDTCSICGEGEQ